MPVLAVRFLAIAGGAAFVLAALQVACGAPPEHDIHLPGGAPVAAVSLPVGGGFNGALTPTVSVADVRCQIYRRTVSPTCPDDASLARAYWPELQRTRDVVFVGLRTRPSCFHMNVEYLAEEHKVLYHCHHAGAWLGINPVVGAAQPADVTDVVMASTRRIAAGRLSLAREDRIEHWIIDLTSESGLGTVTIP
ncbi:MAG: hypothetical protein E6H82_12240 [Chloroflexi bacterium]|nr:MAG: hypothetical protein E6H82_12240 [Chloroflexota bacterium]